MAPASMGDTVRINYRGKLDDGREFDSSDDRGPLEFKIGDNTIIPTLEASVVGMSVGDKATVEIATVDAYGPRRPEAIQRVERSNIPENVELTVGNQLRATGSDGQQVVVTVIETTDTTVTLDGNHPLAGQDLTFEVELVEIVMATV